MRRRELLRAAGLGAAGLAGCLGLFETRQARVPPVLENRPDGVYIPTHVEGMAMAGMAQSGPYRCVLTYTFPHRFWTVTGPRTEQVSIRDEDSVHLMPVVWHDETGQVPADLTPSVSILQGAETVVPSLSPWPMLSQPMGFHYGDNVALPGEGTYKVMVSLGSPNASRYGDGWGSPAGAEFTIPFEFTQSKLDEISFRNIPSDREGTVGAVEPMGMEMTPSTHLPDPSALPGTFHGAPATGDVAVAIGTVPDATPFGGSADQSYLIASPRTIYNGYVLPLMSVSGRVSGGFEGPMTAAIHSEFGYHYGTVVDDLGTGDQVTVTIETTPQAARHEGYETAFFDLEPVSVTV